MDKVFVKKKLKAIVLAFACSINTSALAALPIGSKVPDFSLTTQKNKKLPYRPYFQNKVTLLVLSNYCSVELAGVWAIPLYYRFYKQSDFRFGFVFSNQCLPGFIPQGFVNSSLQNAANSLRLPYILVDWGNQTSLKLKGHAKYAQIYILDREGKVRWQKLLTDPRVSTQAVEKVIQKLLQE